MNSADVGSWPVNTLPLKIIGVAGSRVTQKIQDFEILYSPNLIDPVGS